MTAERRFRARWTAKAVAASAITVSDPGSGAFRAMGSEETPAGVRSSKCSEYGHVPV